jgi:NAD-dependent dihydropyrimidine dehydrogenase PreA subunit
MKCKHTNSIEICLKCYNVDRWEELHKIREHGAVFMVGKNGDTCCECGEPVSVKRQDSHFTEIKAINPIRRRVYERLEKMKLKDLADKVNEAVKELNKLKNERP